MLQTHCEFDYLSLLLTCMELKRKKKFIHSCRTPAVPSKTISDSRAKLANCIAVSDQEGPKTIPFGAAHTYVA